MNQIHIFDNHERRLKKACQAEVPPNHPDLFGRDEQRGGILGVFDIPK